MFKGLRTKIENEKQTGTGGASSTKLDKVSDTVIQQRQHNRAQDPTKPDDKDSFISLPNNTNNSSQPQLNIGFSSISNSKLDNPTPETQAALPQQIQTFAEKDIGTHNEQGIQSFDNKIAELREQLNNALVERDESNEQNAQLYHLIEKLRRNLEVERETNSSLTSKLNDLEQALRKKDCDENQKLSRIASIPNISFDPDKLTVIDTSLPEDVEVLQCKLKELQRDLSKKNRQLKIYQQNINDIRKTLQQEVSDHNKSREEITRLEAELKELSNAQVESRTTDNCELSFNGFSIGDTTDRESLARKCTNVQDDGTCSEKSCGDLHVDRANTSTTKKRTQQDSLSCKSTTSVDELESNDLHKAGGKTNREVSHEYLRNVLYRFLTSTDMETSQRMINAISVLMNFSPEQSAAIKKTLQARSSWLRLK